MSSFVVVQCMIVYIKLKCIVEEANALLLVIFDILEMLAFVPKNSTALEHV